MAINLEDKKKIINYLNKKYEEIDFGDLSENTYLKKIKSLYYLDRKQIFLTIIEIYFGFLDVNFKSKIQEKIKKIDKTTDKISYALSAKFQIDEKYKELLKKIYIELIKSGNSHKILTYIYNIADLIWSLSNDKSTDFNYYTKRLILSLVYIKLIILFFNNKQFNFKILELEIKKALQQAKALSKFKLKLDFISNVNNFLKYFSKKKAEENFKLILLSDPFFFFL